METWRLQRSQAAARSSGGIAPQFSKCARCKLAYYCSKECQVVDWKSRHIKVCKKAAGQRASTANVGRMLQMMSERDELRG